MCLYYRYKGIGITKIRNVLHLVQQRQHVRLAMMLWHWPCTKHIVQLYLYWSTMMADVAEMLP